MKILTHATSLVTLLSVSFAPASAPHMQRNAQLVGPPCEGCEAVLESGSLRLAAHDTLAGFQQASTKLNITGTIYQADGKTPASGVVLYVYHTNQAGLYAPAIGARGWGRRHGAHRGWMKTGPDGKYSLYTFRPGAYPSHTLPAHIHPVILEPDGKYYWIQDYYFADDPLLTEKERQPEAPRGGSTGVLTLQRRGSLWVARRDIILGKNVPGYN